MRNQKRMRKKKIMRMKKTMKRRGRRRYEESHLLVSEIDAHHFPCIQNKSPYLYSLAKFRINVFLVFEFSFNISRRERRWKRRKEMEMEREGGGREKGGG